MKFKIGDKVKIVMDVGAEYPPVNTEGVVVGILDVPAPWPYYVKFDGHNSGLCMEWDKGFDDKGTFALSDREIEYV